MSCFLRLHQRQSYAFVSPQRANVTATAAAAAAAAVAIVWQGHPLVEIPVRYQSAQHDALI